jgi:tetratricopeptide (TPR) repeat protein
MSGYAEKQSHKSVKISQVVQIESKGMLEFNSENDTSNNSSKADKQLGKEMIQALENFGDGKDSLKNTKAISLLNKILNKNPEYADGYLFRAMISLMNGSRDYQRILSDLDKASRYHSSKKYKSSFENETMILGLKAKITLLMGDNLNALNLLETAIKANPGDIKNVFNNGGVKPEEGASGIEFQLNDFNTLISKYPTDYRTYLLRGLFYFTFSLYDEQFYNLALEDLNKALAINPKSAVANYFLGDVYGQKAFWTKAAASDITDVTGEEGGYRAKTNEKALEFYKAAATFDPNFTQAYAQIAQSLYSLKRFEEAIPYYDKVIELDSNNAGAYNDRGLSKIETNDLFGAVNDFSRAIHLKEANKADFLDTSLENRATAYLKQLDYERSIEDYSRAIGIKLSSQIFLMNIQQIRSIYTEFNSLSNQDLLIALHQKYFSNMKFADFSEQLQKNKKPYVDFVLGDLYVKRGDAYFYNKDYRKAFREYSRALNSGASMDRWKIFSKTKEEEYALDLQTLEFNRGSLVSLWTRVLHGDKSHTETNYQIDCSNRKLKFLSTTGYDSEGKIMASSTGKDEWQTIVPESMGEILYSGMCKT